MLIIFCGRGLMLLAWAILVVNLFAPYPRPLNIFMNVALILTMVMHGLQLLLLRATQRIVDQPLTRSLQWRIFLFGIFELLAMQRQQRNKLAEQANKAHKDNNNDNKAK